MTTTSDFGQILNIRGHAAFFDRQRHKSVLTEFGSRAFAVGENLMALMLWDRRCRIDAAKGTDFLARSICLRKLGRPQAALSSLREAQRIDPADLLVVRHAIQVLSDLNESEALCRQIVSDPATSDSDISRALAKLLNHNRMVVAQFWRSGEAVAGWVAWTGPDAPEIEASGPSVRVQISKPSQQSASFRRSKVAFQCDAFDDVSVSGRLHGKLQAKSFLPSDTIKRSPVTSCSAHLSSSKLTIIIPVFRDQEATRACLEALCVQHPLYKQDIVVINDKSPEPGLSQYVSRFCAENGLRLIINQENLGFTLSVNRVLSTCDPGDVLLLNSDVILSPHTLDRLRQVAYSSSSIGTVAPLSNDSASTSFPKSDASNPLPYEHIRNEINAAAWNAHDLSSCDVSTNIGFCLYIKEQCLRAVGPLNPIYGRGYYEDVEFCLHAAEAGYRNVAALGVYVGHASGRSFGSEKSGLASRNLTILSNRFPKFEMQYTTSVQAGPLTEAFSRIEEKLPPRESVVLVISRDGLVDADFCWDGNLAVADPPERSIRLSWTGFGNELLVRFRASDGGVPQSLSFSLDDAGIPRLQAYLSHMRITRLEIAELASVPRSLLVLLNRYRTPIVLLAGSRATALQAWACTEMQFAGFDERQEHPARPSTTPDRGPPDLAAREGAFAFYGPVFVKTIDVMAEAFLAQASTLRSEQSPKADRRRTSLSVRRFKVIGIVAPRPLPDVDILISKLGHAVVGRASILVLGSCIDDLQIMTLDNIFVLGPVKPNEYKDLCNLYSIDALFSPYRTSMFGAFCAAASQTTCPRGFFDWTNGLVEGGRSDLLLDAAANDEDVCSAFRSWCVDRFESLATT